MMSLSDGNKSLVVTCDCEEEACATQLELTPDGMLIIEDADGMQVSLLLPDWLVRVLRAAITAHAPDAQVNQLMAPINLPTWPEPTSEKPDLQTLETWMHEGGGCEATDSCWVEPDGICIHGHPSWILVLGLI